MDNLDSKDYARFATAFGLRLAKSDAAWSYTLSSADSSGLAGKTGREALTYLLTLTIEQDAKTAEAWCRTVLQNDLLLYDHFAKWLMTNGRSPSADSFQRWLTSVDQAFKANLVFGNNDVTNFKSWFCEFLKSDEGWAAVLLRLKVESILIPDAIRTCMAREAIKETPLLWTVYSTACATSGTAVSTIKPRLAEFANRTQFPKLLLEEIEAQNQLAADAIDPIWEELLSGDSAVAERVLQSIRDGLVISNQFALAMLAFDEVAADPLYWQMMLGDAAPGFSGVESRNRRISEEGSRRDSNRRGQPHRFHPEGIAEAGDLEGVADQPGARGALQGQILRDRVAHHPGLRFKHRSGRDCA